MTDDSEHIGLDEVLITGELSRRVPKAPDLAAENEALRTLARQLVKQPQAMFKTLVTIAKQLCQCDAAGVSLLETTAEGEEVFRWVAIAGTLEPFEQGSITRHFSPCNVCLQRQAPQLYRYPARYFTELESLQPAIAEDLVIPLTAGDYHLGAIWILSHDPQRQFDIEDVRVMTSLADFTAAALYNQQINKTLHQRETELSVITNAVPVLISFIDTDKCYRFNNQTYETWFGKAAHEVYGKPMWEVLGQAAYKTIQPYVEQVLSGQQVTFESQVPYREGETRFVSATYIPRVTPQGTVEGFVALVSDISQHKRAEHALRQSEERLRIAQQAAKSGVWNWDIATDQVIWSPEYCHLYGLDPATAEPSYDRWLASIVEADRDRVDYTTRQALEQQLDLNVEFRIQHPEQGERWITAIGQTFYDAKQQPIRMTGIALDITERKRAEAALSQSESRYQTLVKNMPGMIYRYQPSANGSGRFSYVSPGSRELLELEPEAILQDEEVLWSLVHPDDLPSLKSSVAIAIAKRTDWQWEGRLITPSGQMKWIQGRSRAENTEEGDLWDGLLIDISDRKQAEEALANNEAQLRLIIESAKDYAIFTLDMGGYITRWNSGAQRLLGYSEHEILGQQGRIIFVPEDIQRGESEREMEKALHEGRAENERWHLRKDGSRFWASGLLMPLQDDTGNTKGFVKIMQDRTAKRQADERFQLLYDTTSDLLATAQPIQLMNNLFCKLSAQMGLSSYYNYMVERQHNHPMLYLRNYGGISDEMAQSIRWLEFGQHLCGQVAQTQQPIVLNQAQLATQSDAEMLRSLGVTAYAGYPLMAQGRLLGTLAFASHTRSCFTAEEVDLLRSTCEQMAIALERANLLRSIQQQAEQLQQANRIKDEFLAVLSHELRSPLNPILGWAKLLQERKLDAAKTAQALATIERNAKLQAELIEDLLDVSRILQGKLSLNMVPVDLIATTQAAMETVYLAAEAKSIHLQLTVTPPLDSSDSSPLHVLGDGSRIQQVIWNLLSNAVKFTPDGGRVEVRLEQTRNVEEREKRKEGNYTVSPGSLTPSLPDSPTPSLPHSPTPDSPTYAQITVTDTGKGISPSFLPHVFDYFRQADGATTRQFGGLGLGLAIARHLVELHGGTIQVDSLGERMGATFTVRLPLLSNRKSTPQLGQSPLSFSAPHALLSGLHILVVDDDTDSRELIAFVLEQQGATVTAVASATEGWHALSRIKPDLLLSDIGMPDWDGYGLLRQVRTLPPDQGGTIPAIALTAYAGEINQHQATLAGFQRHLSKPIEPDELIKAILNLLSDAVQG